MSKSNEKGSRGLLTLNSMYVACFSSHSLSMIMKAMQYRRSKAHSFSAEAKTINPQAVSQVCLYIKTNRRKSVEEIE